MGRQKEWIEPWVEPEPEVFHETDFVDWQDSSNDDPFEILLRKEQAEAVHAAIDKLPTRRLKKIMLLRMQDLPGTAIAKIMKRSQGWENQLEHRAIRELRLRKYGLSEMLYGKPWPQVEREREEERRRLDQYYRVHHWPIEAMLKPSIPKDPEPHSHQWTANWGGKSFQVEYVVLAAESAVREHLAWCSDVSPIGEVVMKVRGAE